MAVSQVAGQQAKLSPIEIFNGQWPANEPRAIAVQLDFTAQTSYIVDLSEEAILDQLAFVQTVYIDNSLNAEPLTITVDGTLQNITVGANVQAYRPILCKIPRFLVSVPALLPAGTLLTKIHFINVPIAALVDNFAVVVQDLWTPSNSVVGSYSMGLASGVMAAGLAAGSPIAAFRYGGTNLCIVRKIWLSVQDIVAFTAGEALFNTFAARAFTASDTGGTPATLTGNNGKLRTSFATTGVADFRVSSTATLGAGTRTLDATPLDATVIADASSLTQLAFGPYAVLGQSVGEQPLQLAQNEGFEIQATVPATGTWSFSVKVQWDEVVAY